jgi:hypothetical protein
MNRANIYPIKAQLATLRKEVQRLHLIVTALIWLIIDKQLGGPITCKR